MRFRTYTLFSVCDLKSYTSVHFSILSLKRLCFFVVVVVSICMGMIGGKEKMYSRKKNVFVPATFSKANPYEVVELSHSFRLDCI